MAWRVVATLLQRFVLLWLVAGAGLAWSQPLMVQGRSDLAVWPAVTVYADADEGLGVEQVLALPERFVRHQGTASNLGRSTRTAWLRFTVFVPGTETVERVLELNYPTLNLVDVYLVSDARVVQHLQTGNTLRMADRPLRSRALATPLMLAPGEHLVLMRVHTQTSMVLPMTLRTPASFAEQEAGMHMALGVVVGLSLCMLLYSLTHWVGLRDRLFLDYAALLASNMVFMLTYFGIGALYLWPDWPALSSKVAPMAVMVAIAAATRFTTATLATPGARGGFAGALKLIGLAAVGSLAATLLGFMDYRTAQTTVTVLGIATTAVVLPMAYLRARGGERAARYMLIGWTCYSLGALLTAALLRGFIEPTFLGQHVYAMSLMVEMAAWMAVLSLRVQAIHRNADRARVETETLRTLSQTDALTGLPNRRGLQQHLAQVLPQAHPQQLLALYLLDLDGFKPINDRYGHDVGDALLVEVGRRLQAQLRGSDIVARLGGDEFVVLASNLADETIAHAVGKKLLAAFDTPFYVSGQRCEVGLTVGYALAPLDSSSADELLKRADAAMYAGKQAGRRCVQRGGRSLAMA